MCMAKSHRYILIIGILFLSAGLRAQHHEDRVYFRPEDSLVIEKLAWWRI